MRAFPWFEAPSEEALTRALTLLTLLGACKEGRITALGQKMSQWPLPVRLARMMMEGHRLGQTRKVSLAAAMLAEGDPFGGSPYRATTMAADSDVMERVVSLEALASGRRSHLGLVSVGARRSIERAAKQCAQIASRAGLSKSQQRCGPEEALGRALLQGFPDRVAKR